MFKRFTIVSLIILPVFIVLIQTGIADDNRYYDVKELKDAGEITSLENILSQLTEHDINRLLEVELERENNRYIYEIEYLDSKGIVYEVEVDAITAEVIKTKREY